MGTGLKTEESLGVNNHDQFYRVAAPWLSIPFGAARYRSAEPVERQYELII